MSTGAGTTFQTKIDFLIRSTSAKPYFVHLGKKFISLSEMGQRGPDGPKWSKTIGLTILVPFGPLWNVDKPAPCLAIFGQSPVMIDPKVKKRPITRSPMC